MSKIYTVAEMQEEIDKLEKLHAIATAYGTDAAVTKNWIHKRVLKKYYYDRIKHARDCYRRFFDSVEWSIQSPDVKKVMKQYIMLHDYNINVY